MKNRIISIAVILLAIMAAFLSGCKKENLSPSNTDNTEQITNTEGTKQWPYQYTGLKTYYEYRRIVDHLGRVIMILDPHCAYPYSGTCLPEVVIVSSRGDEQNDLAVLFMAYHKEDKANMFFKTQDYLRLYPDLEKLPHVVKAIMEDEIVFLDRYNEQTSTHYYVGLPKNYQNNHLNENEKLGDLIEKEALCTFVVKDLR